MKYSIRRNSRACAFIAAVLAARSSVAAPSDGSDAVYPPRKRIAAPLQTPSRTEQLRQELRPLVTDKEEFSSADRNRLKQSADSPILV